MVKLKRTMQFEMLVSLIFLLKKKKKRLVCINSESMMRK